MKIKSKTNKIRPLPPVYQPQLPATFRAFLAHGQDDLIGVAFTRYGAAIRLALTEASAQSLSQLLADYFEKKAQSAMSGEMPSVEVSTPDEGI